jgi:hypothetical protein
MSEDTLITIKNVGEENGCFNVLNHHLPGETEENHKTSSSIAGFWASKYE